MSLSTSWTVERENAVRDLWARGLSATEIAIELGGGVSRNGVIGKVHRLGLSGRRRATKLRERKEKPKPYLATDAKHIRETSAQKSAARKERTAAAEQKAIFFEAVEVVDLAPEESACAVPFMKLSADTCRWPLGDPRDLNAMRFCGVTPKDSSPYCLRHHRMAYVKPGQQERAA